MNAEYGTVYVLVTVDPGKEQDLVYEVQSDESFLDSRIEKMIMVHGSVDFLVVISGNSYEIDRRILKMRKLPYVQDTQTLIPFKWEIPKEKPRPPKPPTVLPRPPEPTPAILPPQEFELEMPCEHPIVIYSTKSGNTKKVAEEIADELKCPLTEVTKDSDFSTLNLSDFDLVYIGTGIYRDHPNENLVSFLRTAEFGNQKLALFMTWLGLRKGDKDVFDKIDGILETKGRRLLGNYFECRGDFPNGYPDARDFEKARNWAKKVGGRTAH
jgi:flavodoxin